MHALLERTRPVAVGPPSALLRYLAGDFAPRIAGLWPQPHTPFLTSPADRRHLVCLALTLAGGDVGLPEPDVLLDAGLADAIGSVIVDPPHGLRRALAHMGETAWMAADYRALLALLRHPHGCKLVRHAQRIDPALVATLSLLPSPLVEAGVGSRFALKEAQARLLADAWRAVVRNRTPAEAAAEALRWGGAATAKVLFTAVQDGMLPEVPAPPFPGTARLRHLPTKAAMRDAAARYQNCLRSCIGRATKGLHAFYEWVGPPGVIVEIWNEPAHGWRLDEARASHNCAPPLAVREEINAELRSWGVHVGRTQWQLETAAENACEPWFSYVGDAQAIGELYGDD